ncbi:hypothetical protein CCH79_00015900, partial [Gambusia affinis]
KEKPLSGCVTGGDLGHSYTGQTVKTGLSLSLSPAVAIICVSVDAEMMGFLQHGGVKPSDCLYQKQNQDQQVSELLTKVRCLVNDAFVIFFIVNSPTGKPKAQLSSNSREMPAGGSVTLTCVVGSSSSGWKYFWYKERDSSEPLTGEEAVFPSNGQMSVSEEGLYWCRGGRGEPVYYTDYSDRISITKNVTVSSPASSSFPVMPVIGPVVGIILIILLLLLWRYRLSFQSESSGQRPTTNHELNQTESDYSSLAHVSNKVVVTQRPNWPLVFSGESITLACEVQGGETTEWTKLNRIAAFCCSTRNAYTFAEDGKIELSCRIPVLSVSPSWPNPGASVTLSCEGLELQSAGWRFFWYKTVPDTSKQHYRPSYTYELLPGSTNGTEQNSFIINGPTLTAGFKCRAGRGEQKFYTYYSEVKFVWSADPRPAASLSVNPDRVQHFRSESVTLSCEGNSDEWRVMRFTEKDGLSYCSDWGTMNGSTCTTKPYYDMDGVYWCESKSGEFSNVVNITLQTDYYGGIILVSPVHPVTEGDPVTLSCRDIKQNLLSNVFFYHNDKLINNDGREELKISAVSKSDEGFYKCQYSGKKSPRSWIRVTGCSPASSLFLVLMVIGPVVKIVLVLLLLLFLCCRRNNDSTPTYANINYLRKYKDYHYYDIILVSPVHPVTEGDPVTLSCRDKNQNLLSNVFFHHNNKLLQNHNREELKISAVPVGSSFPVMLIVGPVVGVVLIILVIVLLLLWRCRRLNQPDNINPASATNHEVTQNDDSVYNSLLHGDSSLYETIHLSGASG